MLKDFVAVDIEATGLSPEKEKIIEIGAVKYRNGIQTEVFSSLINPEWIVSERITELTHITNDMLKDAPHEEYVIKQYLDFVGDEVILGHNIGFDYSFLKAAAERYGYLYEVKAVDTLRIAKTCHMELESRTLGNMCSHYGIINENAHRALDDALATAKLYICLAEKFAEKEEYKKLFEAEQLVYKLKKKQPATAKQIKYLQALLEVYDTGLKPDFNTLTKNDASRIIDRIKSQSHIKKGNENEPVP